MTLSELEARRQKIRTQLKYVILAIVYIDCLMIAYMLLEYYHGR